MKVYTRCLLLLIFTLGACSGNSANLTAEANPSQTISIDKGSKGLLSVDYAEGWAARLKEPEIRIGSSEDVLEKYYDSGANIANQGEIALMINLIATNVVDDVARSYSVSERVNALIIVLSDLMDMGIDFDDIEQLDIQGHNAGMITRPSQTGSGRSNVTIFVSELNSYYVMIIGISHRQDIERVENAVLAMAETLRLER